MKLTKPEIESLIREARTLTQTLTNLTKRDWYDSVSPRLKEIESALLDALGRPKNQTQDLLEEVYREYVKRSDGVPLHIVVGVIDTILNTPHPDVQRDINNASSLGLPLERMSEWNKYMESNTDAWPESLINYVRGFGGGFCGDALACAVAEWMKLGGKA